MFKKTLLISGLILSAMVTTGFTNEKIDLPALDSNVESYIEQLHGQEVESDQVVRVIKLENLTIRADSHTNEIKQIDNYCNGYHMNGQTIGSPFQAENFDGKIHTTCGGWDYYTKKESDGSLTRFNVYNGVLKSITKISKTLADI